MFLRLEEDITHLRLWNVIARPMPFALFGAFRWQARCNIVPTSPGGKTSSPNDVSVIHLRRPNFESCKLSHRLVPFVRSTTPGMVVYAPLFLTNICSVFVEPRQASGKEYHIQSMDNVTKYASMGNPQTRCPPCSFCLKQGHFSQMTGLAPLVLPKTSWGWVCHILRPQTLFSSSMSMADSPNRKPGLVRSPRLQEFRFCCSASAGQGCSHACLPPNTFQNFLMVFKGKPKRKPRSFCGWPFKTFGWCSKASQNGNCPILGYDISTSPFEIPFLRAREPTPTMRNNLLP